MPISSLPLRALARGILIISRPRCPRWPRLGSSTRNPNLFLPSNLPRDRGAGNWSGQIRNCYVFWSSPDYFNHISVRNARPGTPRRLVTKRSVHKINLASNGKMAFHSPSSSLKRPLPFRVPCALRLEYYCYFDCIFSILVIIINFECVLPWFCETCSILHI